MKKLGIFLILIFVISFTVGSFSINKEKGNNVTEVENVYQNEIKILNDSQETLITLLRFMEKEYRTHPNSAYTYLNDALIEAYLSLDRRDDAIAFVLKLMARNDQTLLESKREYERVKRIEAKGVKWDAEYYGFYELYLKAANCTIGLNYDFEKFFLDQMSLVTSDLDYTLRASDYLEDTFLNDYFQEIIDVEIASVNAKDERVKSELQ